MKTIMGIWFGVLVTAFLLRGLAWAGESPSPASPSLFAATAQQCDKEIQTKIAELQEQYLKELSAVRQTYQGLGDLDKVLAAKNEQERFARSKTVAEEDLIEGPEEIRELQEKYQGAISQASRQVAQGYINRLLETKKALTREDKLSDAVVVQKQIEVLARKYLADGEEPELIPAGSSTTGSVGTRKGLVLHFSFSDKDGKKVFSRAGGKVVEGRLMGGASITNKGKKRGAALQLDGEGSFVSFPDDRLPMDNAPRSVAVWLQTGATNLRQVIFLYGRQRTGDAAYLLIFEHSQKVTLGNWGGGGEYRGRTLVADDQWHHVAFVYDGAGTVAIYVDGQLDFTANRSYSTTPGGGTLSIDYPGHGFRGVLDEFMVYNRALSAAEVKQLYLSQK